MGRIQNHKKSGNADPTEMAAAESVCSYSSNASVYKFQAAPVPDPDTNETFLTTAYLEIIEIMTQ